MVRKKFDRTVVKKCPKCEEQVPVACKFCTCGHQFASRNKLLLKEEAEEAMGLLDRSDTNKDDESPMDRLRRPRRLSRDKPTYYVITELNRQVKRARQKVKPTISSDLGAVGELAIPKKKKRGRPRGSGSRNKSKRKTIIKQETQLQLQQPKHEPLILQLPKQERQESMEQDSLQATSSSPSSSSSSSPQTPPSQSYYHQLQELEFSDTKLATSPTPSLSIATSSGIDRKLNLSSTCSATSNNFGNSSNPIVATASSNNSSIGEISIKIDNRTSFTATTPSPPLSSSSSTSSTSLSAAVNISNNTTTSSSSKNKGGTTATATISSSTSSSNTKNINTTTNNNNSSNQNNNNSNMMIINNAMHSKDNNNSNSSINSVSSSNSSNSTITTNYGTKVISNSDSNSNIISISNNTNNNNNSNNNNNNSSSSSSNNNNNNGTSNNNGSEKDMHSNITPERALQFYAILADLNRKIISQSFKPW